jgi:hypothetical protein
MPNQLPVTIDFGTLPQTGQGYTPQEFANRLGTNGRIFTEQAFALFVTGSTAPTSDVGPWAANGNSWYYWDSGTGTYVPFIVPPESLKYSVSAVEPDPAIYLFWIKLDGLGSPLGVFTYYSGAWVDVYAAAGYLTVAAFNAAIASYSTTAQMNTAIGVSAAATLASANAYTDAAVGSIPGQDNQPARATTDGTQTIPTTGTPTDILFPNADIDPGSNFNTTTGRYEAPVTGIYQVSVISQFDNDTGTAASMEVTLGLSVDGTPVGPLGDVDSTPSPNGARWSPGFSGLINLAAGEALGVVAGASDGVGTGVIDVTNIAFSINRVPSA